MTKEEKELLLVTARVLRAHLTDLRDTTVSADLLLDDDIAAIQEALEPFEAVSSEPASEKPVSQ